MRINLILVTKNCDTIFFFSVILGTNQASHTPSEAQVVLLLNYKTVEVLWAWWLSGVVLTQSTPLAMNFSVQLFLCMGRV